MPQSLSTTRRDEVVAADMTLRPTILVTGATGKVGRAVVDTLAPDPSVHVRAAARFPDKSGDMGVPVVWLDFDRTESLRPALDGVEAVFLTTGYTVDMLRQSKSFIDAARHAGVKHIVHLGACGDDDTTVAHWAWHQLVERYIEWAGVTYTHLRPEFFMQNLLGYGQRRGIEKGRIIGYVNNARASWVDCDDVAAVAAACLRDRQKHAGRTYRLGYDSKSYGEIAALLTEVVGRPFTYVSAPPDEFLERVLAAGAEPTYMRSVHQSHLDAAAGRIPHPDSVFDNFETITGRQPTTWRSFVEKHRSEFSY